MVFRGEAFDWSDMLIDGPDDDKKGAFYSLEDLEQELEGMFTDKKNEVAEVVSLQHYKISKENSNECLTGTELECKNGFEEVDGIGTVFSLGKIFEDLGFRITQESIYKLVERIQNHPIEGFDIHPVENYSNKKGGFQYPVYDIEDYGRLKLILVEMMIGRKKNTADKGNVSFLPTADLKSEYGLRDFNDREYGVAFDLESLLERYSEEVSVNDMIVELKAEGISPVDVESGLYNLDDMGYVETYILNRKEDRLAS